MTNYVVASGEQIYQSAIEGAKRKYNRSTDNYSVYEKMLSESYEYMLSDSKNKAANKRIRQRTKNNWRNANFAVCFYMFHKHKAMQPCETHVRVSLMLSPTKIFDIPLDYWNMFEQQTKKVA